MGYVLIALLAAGAVIWQHCRTRRILESIDRMLERAIAGDFTAQHYDESLPSAVEEKLARYLSSSAMSARKVQAEKEALKTLVADISHQTKTPISNILLYAQLLSEQPGDETCLRELTGQAQKLQSLIEALVKTSRLETGIIALHPISGPVEPVLQSALAQLRPKAAAKGMQLFLDPTTADAVFDRKWTEEAVYNLLDNAVKYAAPGGSIRIQAVLYPLFCAIEVSDDGPGIPESEQPLVFQRFYRGANHHQTEGVGIGLYLVRQIAQGQGGYVKLRSHPGQGCTFSLFLPRS